MATSPNWAPVPKELHYYPAEQIERLLKESEHSYMIMPDDDAIGHNERWGACVCGPELFTATADDGKPAVLIAHQALDGRD